MVGRWLPVRDGGDLATRRVPRGRGRCACHGPPPVRHPLHGAVPRPSGRAPRRVRTPFADGRRGEARAPAPVDPWTRRRQRVRGAHAAALGGAVRGRTASRARLDPERYPPHAVGGGDREPAPNRARLPPAFTRPVDTMSDRDVDTETTQRVTPLELFFDLVFV